MNNSHSKSGRIFVGNVVFNVLSLAAPLLFAFVATPLLVRALGVDEYGYYSLVLAVIGFGFTTGIARTPAKYIPEKRASSQTAELAALLSAAIFITLAVAIVEGAAIAFASPFLVSQFLGVPDAAAERLKYAIYLACAIGVVTMLSHLFQSSLQGVHRFRKFSTITIAAAFLLNLGSVVLAVNDFPYTDIFVWNLAVIVIAAAAFFVFAKAEVPELSKLRTIDKTTLQKVGAFAASIFVYQSITSIFYIFERSYILRNYGPEALTYYTIPLMLGFYLHGLILAVSQVTIPKFNERVLDRAGLLAIYQTLTKLVVSGSLFLALIYYLQGSELLELWVGHDFAVRSSWLLVIDGAAFALIAVLIPAWILSESARRPGINASSPVVTSLIGMAAIILLGSIYQIEGVASGRLIGGIAALPIIVIVERLVFERIQWKLWLSIAVGVVPASLAMFLVDTLIVSNLGKSWFGFLISTALLTLGYWPTLLLTGYTTRSEMISAFASAAASDQDAEPVVAMR